MESGAMDWIVIGVYGGLIEGIRESLFDRARRISTGDRVAEASESHEPQE